MSSHREAPEISKDPVADSTDVYAFVSPDDPDYVTILANYIPFQKPDGGPNFFEFGEDVRYEINISNDASDAKADLTYRFEFSTYIRDKSTFLYNTGVIEDINDTTWNRPQLYRFTRLARGKVIEVVDNLTAPPVNVGVRSTPDYAHLGDQAVHQIGGGRRVFAGQRADAFHVDLGSVFDLAGLRPFNSAHLISLPPMNGVNGLQSFNVHTLGVKVPKTDLTSDGSDPTDVSDQRSVIGVWTAASRQKSRIFDRTTATFQGTGPYQQVSRLANPLFNEVLVPMAEKDVWNSRRPGADARYAKYVNHPELAQLIPVLYPGVFPNLAAYRKARADLHAILLTGLPPGVVDGFQNYTGPRPADMVRLNMAVPPATQPNSLGLVGGDPAGFPNGRRLVDDVVTIELRAIAGQTIPLVDPSYTPDAAAAAVTDGTSDTNAPHLDVFPYLGLPGGGYETMPGTTMASGASTGS